VKFEVDEKGLGHVLRSLKDIEEQIDAHSGLTTSWFFVLSWIWFVTV